MVWPTLGSRTAKEQNRTAWTANQSSPTWSRTCPDSPSEGLLGPGSGGYTLQASSPSRSVTVTPLGSFLAIKPCPRHAALAGSSSDVATTLLSTTDRSPDRSLLFPVPISSVRSQSWSCHQTLRLRLETTVFGL